MGCLGNRKFAPAGGIGGRFHGLFMVPCFGQPGRGVLERVRAPAVVDPVKGPGKIVSVPARGGEEVALVDMCRDQIGEYHPHLLVGIPRAKQLLEAADRLFYQFARVRCGAGSWFCCWHTGVGRCVSGWW